ncbi:MAG: hypothetical protein AAF447_07795 [Myxococcota bacterium]
MACGGGGGTPSLEGGTCVRDEARIDAREACVTDEHCPCGAHCALGECIADCRSDGDCGGGERCDTFGYCRDADDTARIPAFPPAEQGTLIVSATRIELFDESMPRPVRVSAANRSLGTLRALADEGLEVSCDGAAFETECRLEGVALGEVATLTLRATTPLEDDEVRLLRVFTGTQRELISVTAPATVAAMMNRLPGDATPAIGGPLAGVYQGEARLLGSVLSAAPDADIPRRSRPESLPVTASVHAAADTGPGVLVLEDASARIAGVAEWVGALDVRADGGGTVDFPTTLAHQGSAAFGTTVEVRAEAPAAEVTVDAVGARSVAFTVRTVERGAFGGGVALQSDWAVTLYRADDLPDGSSAPAVPADVAATLDAERGGLETPWEAELGDALRAFVAAPDDLYGVRGEVFPSFTGEGANVLACAVLGTEPGLRPTAWLDAFRDGELNVGPEGAAFRRVLDGVVAGSELEAYLAASPSPLATMILPAIAGDPPYFFEEVTLEAGPVDYGDALPCAFSTETTLLGERNGFPTSADLRGSAAVDVCAAMAERYDCERVVSAPGDTAALPVGSLLEDEFGVTEFEGTLTLDVTERCLLPSATERPLVARDCGELVACFDPATSTGGASARLGSEVLRASGDLRCISDAGGAIRGGMIAADVNVGDLSQPAMVRECITDLEALLADPAGAALGTALSEGACVGAVRLLYAMSQSFERTRLAAVDAQVRPRLREETFGARLLQRWLQLHTFIARQSEQGEQLAQVIRRDPGGDVLPPPIDEALEASLRGWELLLHPRIADVLLLLDGEALTDADYRPFAGAFTDELPNGRDQVEGLAVAILDALAAQLALVRIRVERALNTGDLSANDVANGLLAQVQRVRPVAEALRARATAWADANGRTVPWESRYAATSNQLDGELAALAADMQSLREGRNPFGIEDEDLPLYFLADDGLGAGGRFSAISDFLLGPSPGSTTNFAPFAIVQAEEALTAARTAWVDFQDRETARDQVADMLAEQLDDIRMSFGSDIGAYCGTPGDLLTVDVLEGWEAAQGEPFSADTCFFDRGESGCSFDDTAWAALLSADDVLFQLCVAAELDGRLGDVPALGVPAVAGAIADLERCAADADFPATCTGGGSGCFTCRAGAVSFAPNPGEMLALSGGAPEGVLRAARTACAQRFPTANPQLPATEQADASALGNPACYRGSLGEAVLTSRAIAQDVTIARSELAEFQERYDIAMRSCLILQTANDMMEAAIAQHNETMSGLRAGKLAADVIANAAGAAKDCASTVAGSDVTGKAAIGVACGAAAAEAVADSVSDGLQFAMDEAQQSHETLLAMLERGAAEDQCFNDAEIELVGTRTAALRVQRAASDLQLALFQVAELKAQADGAFADGTASLEASRGRDIAPMAHDYWLDERLDTYVRRMRTARRLAYLTVRAVEYEYQASLGLRSQVLTAEVPEDLNRALETLWSTAGTRRIGTAAPTELKIVLSLKRNVLQLSDESDLPAGELALSDTERLRRLLLDPRYEVYEDGIFMGRSIPFNLVPLETLGLGETQGVAVFARDSCAERLWSVNATLQGDEGRLFLGDDPSFVNIRLLKANTFYSQWCADGNATRFQEASVRPSRNLFADPAGGSSIGDRAGLGSEIQLFSTARVQAPFNVERDRFSDDEFANGNSSELAARGLFGRYALFFPAAVLSEGGGTGLDLNAVDDILLRLDYLSVAR